jgi:hypothetical protein
VWLANSSSAASIIPQSAIRDPHLRVIMAIPPPRV